MRELGAGSGTEGLWAGTIRAKKQPSRLGGCRGLHTRSLCQLPSPRCSCTCSVFLSGLWFETLSGSGWGFGGQPQRNRLAGTACSRASSIPPPIMPQLFPVKHFFISDSTLSSMKENIEREKEGRKEEREGRKRKESVTSVLWMCSWLFSPVDSVPPGEHPALWSLSSELTA